MSWYLLLTDNVDQIDGQSEKIVERCNQHFAREFAVYRPLPFVDHTGFTETVVEEIEFVIGAQLSVEGAHLDPTAFVTQWNLEHLAAQRVVNLSGGWRKFLGVALFANRKAGAKCFLDVTSHLADDRVRMLLEQLKSQANEFVVFCEYDAHLISEMSPGHFSLLIEREDKLDALDRFPRSEGTSLQSNYEHS